jgi:hypothetical protein
MEAHRFQPHELPSEEELQELAAGRGADVAIEFCFKLEDGAEFFFGVRCGAGLNTEQIVLFLSRGLSCGRGDMWTGFQDFLSRLEGSLSLEAGSLNQKLENVEIGIVDYWRRGDVVEVWSERSEALPSLEQLSDLMGKFPSLDRNTIKFVCLESNFMTPLHHWFGVEVSSETGGEHVLDVTVAHRRLVENLSPTLQSFPRY